MLLLIFAFASVFASGCAWVDSDHFVGCSIVVFPSESVFKTYQPFLSLDVEVYFSISSALNEGAHTFLLKEEKKSTPVVVVCVVEGIYFESIKIDDSFSVGNLPRAVHVRGLGLVRVSAGLPILLEPLSPEDPARHFLPPAIADSILGVNLLEDYNISDFGSWSARGGFEAGCAAAPLQLIAEGNISLSARWPNADPMLFGGPFAQTSAWWLPPAHRGPSPNDYFVFDSSSPGAGLYQTPPALCEWPSELLTDLWVHGYWWWDWEDRYMQVDRVSCEASDSIINITVIPPTPPLATNITYGARFYFTNSLGLLDAPFESWLNVTSGMLYYFPSGPFTSLAGVVTLNDTVFSATDLQNYVLEDMVFEAARGGGVSCLSCRNISIINCTIRNIGGGFAADFYLSNNTLVENLTSYDLGGGGVHYLDGGDRELLLPSGNCVRNSVLHNFQRQCFTYMPAVALDTGALGEHNELYNSPHSAASISGNDIVFQYNILHHTTMDTFDNAPVYWFPGDWTKYNNTMRYNFLYLNGGLNTTCNENTQHFRSGIYMDNAGAGLNCYGNVVYQPLWSVAPCNGCTEQLPFSYALNNDGGRNSNIFNNMVIDVNLTYNSGGMLTWDTNGQINTSVYFQDMKMMNWNAPPYSIHYPDLALLQDFYTSECFENPLCPSAPFNNSIYTSILVNSTGVMLFPPSTNPFNALNFNVTNNWVAGQDPGFEAGANARATLNFQLLPSSPAYAMGFERIPMECFGPCSSACASC